MHDTTQIRIYIKRYIYTHLYMYIIKFDFGFSTFRITRFTTHAIMSQQQQQYVPAHKTK